MRFPFAFACPDMTSATIIGCLNQLFAIFGMAAYIHSDRGTLFMSAELVHYLTSKGIATSHTTLYNPRGNGQTERYNVSYGMLLDWLFGQNRCTFHNGIPYCKTRSILSAHFCAWQLAKHHTSAFSISNATLHQAILFQVGYPVQVKYC